MTVFRRGGNQRSLWHFFFMFKMVYSSRNAKKTPPIWWKLFVKGAGGCKNRKCDNFDPLTPFPSELCLKRYFVPQDIGTTWIFTHTVEEYSNLEHLLQQQSEDYFAFENLILDTNILQIYNASHRKISFIHVVKWME